MKKILAAGCCLVVLAVSLTGCSLIRDFPNVDPAPLPTPTPTPTPIPPPPPPPPGPVCWKDVFPIPPATAPCNCWHMPPTGNGNWELAPCPLPPPPPPPPPPVETDPAWRESDGTETCPLGGKAAYLTEVRAALMRALDEGVVTNPWTAGEAALYSAMLPQLELHGLKAALLSEELAVQKGQGFSENYDLLRADGAIIQGTGSFKSTCYPALRTQALPVLPPHEPGGFPMPVSAIRIKVHVPSSQRPDGRAVIDGVALHCGTPSSHFPGRPCYPACGPEEPAEARTACDIALMPVWTGGHPHNTNPWLRFAHPGTTVKACIGRVCSDPLVAK